MLIWDRLGAPDVVTRSIVRDGIAVGVATGAYGISFRAISVASGLDVWQSCALSLLVFTGASQFALLGAAVALSLVPVTPAGVPMLAASVVALGLGLTGQDAAETGEKP